MWHDLQTTCLTCLSERLSEDLTNLLLIKIIIERLTLPLRNGRIAIVPLITLALVVVSSWHSTTGL